MVFTVGSSPFWRRIFPLISSPLNVSSRLASNDAVAAPVANIFEGQRELRGLLKDRNLMGSGSVDLTLDESSRIATVTLNQPEKRNAISGSMMMDFGHVTSELSTWRSGVGVVLRGAGANFCSGGDLDLVKGIMEPDEGALMSLYMNAVLTQFYRLPLVSVALIEGVALGGGAEISTACDFRFLHPDARIGFVQSRMGLSTGWGGGTRLVQLVGRRHALRLLVSATSLRASEAREFGLADQVFEEGQDPTDVALDFLEKITSNKETNVLRTCKMISSISAEQDSEQAVEIERIMFSTLWGSEAHLAAIRENVKHKD